jgi:beta-galactosidase/beta-glucuronidase
MYPHRIRLRGPWECEPLARLGADDRAEPPPARRMTMPCRWGEAGLADFAGRVRFRRRFGYPGRIDSHERVWLTFAGIEAVAEVRLNDHFLGRREGKDGPFEFEVTPLLQARNELIVDVEAASDRGGLWGEVALEVRLAQPSP